MANHLSHILPYPILNARYTLPISFRVAAGTPTDPATPDTEFSTDGGATFADCAEEITTGGANGLGYLTLSGAETNNRVLLIAAKSANCVTTPVILHCRALASIGTGTLSAGSAGGGTLGTLLAYDVTNCFVMTTGGTGGGGTGGANNQARRILTYNTGTGAFTVSTWETTPDATTTYTILLPEGVTLGMLRALNPATAGRTLVVDTAGLADANTVKLGPTGSGTAQTARDLGLAIPAAVAGATGGLFIAGTNAATTVTTAFTTTFTGNLTGSVASVSGAVGGNVGGIAGTTQTLDALQTALNSAHGAGSWATATGFSILTTADIDARLAAYDGPTNAEMVARTIVSAAYAQPGDAMTLTAGERTAIAAEVFKLDLSTLSGEASRSLLNAIRKLRNKWAISGTTLSVFKENDSDVAYTQPLTATAGAAPITGIAN